MRWPNISKAGAYLLADMVGGIEHAGTETPVDLQERLPFIRVGRFGGPDDGTSDLALVEVDYFAADPDKAFDGAEDVRQFLLSGYHFIRYPDGQALIDSVATVTGPHQRPWLGTGLVRVTGVYRFVTRRS